MPSASARRSKSGPEVGTTIRRAAWGALALLVLAHSGAVAAGPSDVIGYMDAHMALAEDTLPDLAIEHGLGYVEIVAANPGVDPWLPPEGTFIVLPKMHVLPKAERRGIVINLAEMRLYWFPPKGDQVTMPLGIGSEGWTSPKGVTRVVRKRANPTWYPPPSVRAEEPDLPSSVPPGPDNPLGTRALYLGWPAIVLHGTNRPYGIGRRVSHGCFRLSNRDVEWLFERVPVGTRVVVVDQPVKVGWREDVLYLEIHPTQSQADQLERGEPVTPIPVSGLPEMILPLVNGDTSRIDWTRVAQAARERSGVPVAISRRDGS